MKYISIDKLKQNESNPRVIKDIEFKKLCKSLKNNKNFFESRPIIVDHNYKIIAGNQRYEASKHLGFNEVPVYMLPENISKKEIESIMLLDNKHNGEWDFKKLMDGFDKTFLIDDIGFNEFELNFKNEVFSFENIEKEDDREKVLSDIKTGKIKVTIDMLPKETKQALIEELKEEKMNSIKQEVKEINESRIEVSNKEPLVNYGDIFEIKSGDLIHRVMCGDSTKKEDVERLMNGNKADLLITDPPYGIDLETDFTYAKSNLNFICNKKGLGGKKYKKVIGDGNDFSDKLILSIFENFNYCREMFIFGADYYFNLISGFKEGTLLVWDKRLDESADKMYGSCFELVWSKQKHKREIIRIKWAGLFGIENEFDKKRSHPTQKPTHLIKNFIEKYSLENKIVIDSFLGSGTTLIACQETNRNCYGMELDQHYIEVILRRYSSYIKDKPHTITCLNRQLNISDILNNV